MRVPLALSAAPRVPLGPMDVPLRSLILVAASAPLSFALLSLAGMSLTMRMSLALAVTLGALAVSLPVMEGIWWATWWALGICGRLMPNAVINGVALRARIVESEAGVRLQPCGPGWPPPRLRPRGLPSCTRRAQVLADGVFALEQGAQFVVCRVHPPSDGLGTDAYGRWCESLVGWLMAVGRPAQLLSYVEPNDPAAAMHSFGARTASWPTTPLWMLERRLVGAVAAETTRLRQYVIFESMLAPAARPFGGRRRAETTVPAASTTFRLLADALRLGAAAGLDLTPAPAAALQQLLSAWKADAGDVVALPNGVIQQGDVRDATLTITALPSTIASGALVDALLHARCRCVASVHVCPVPAGEATRQIRRQLALHRYVADHGSDTVGAQVAAADATAALTAVAQRATSMCRMAVSLRVMHHDGAELEVHVAKLAAALQVHGLTVTRVTRPALLPRQLSMPGAHPLRRSRLMTADAVAACLIPVVGAPFARANEPLIGVLDAASMCASLSVWAKPNHNLVVLGSSGAGKSMSMKALLVRHVLEGATALVIDPDSEYRAVMNAISGQHVELGEHALNPFAIAREVSPDLAAALILPVISVMAGDERGIRDGKPIRRLRDEDQGWLHTLLASFFATQATKRTEPVLHDFMSYAAAATSHAGLSTAQRRRLALVLSRLERFTRGMLASVFDRSSTIPLGASPTAVGMRSLALNYAADLTAAVALILTHALALLRRGQPHLLVVVDEAHRVIGDPDAGEVLSQLVRQARKYAAGVWMCSQNVGDFVGMPLGQVLVATAATKLLMGIEEPSVAGVTAAFQLRPDELRAITPPVRGRGVLVSGSERAVIHVVAGPAMMAIAGASDDVGDDPLMSAA